MAVLRLNEVDFRTRIITDYKGGCCKIRVNSLKDTTLNIYYLIKEFWNTSNTDGKEKSNKQIHNYNWKLQKSSPPAHSSIVGSDPKISSSFFFFFNYLQGRCRHLSMVSLLCPEKVGRHGQVQLRLSDQRPLWVSIMEKRLIRR